MAFVVRKPGSNITEAQVIDFIAKQVRFKINIQALILIRRFSYIFPMCSSCIFSLNDISITYKERVREKDTILFFIPEYN